MNAVIIQHSIYSGRVKQHVSAKIIATITLNYKIQSVYILQQIFILKYTPFVSL